MLTGKKKPTHDSIQVIYDSFRTLQFQDPSLSHVRLMDASIHALLDLNFCGQQDWRTMDSNKCFESLLREYPEARNSSQSTTEERFRNLDKRLVRVDIDDPKCHDGLFLAIQAILEVPDEAPLSQPRIEDLCKILTRMIGKDTPANKRLQLHMESTEFKPTKLNDWFWRVRKEMDRVYQATLTLREYGVSCEQQRRDDKGHDKGNGGHKDHEKPKGKRIRDAEECTSCGRQNHTTANCLLKTHPDANKSAEPWPQSVSGKAWKAKSEEVLPFTRTLSGESWICPVQPKGKFPKRQKCECNTIASLDTMTGNTDVVPCDIILTDTSLTTHMLVDSGALDGDYINREIADKLRAVGVKPVGARKRVCSAFNEMCEITEGNFHCKSILLMNTHKKWK